MSVDWKQLAIDIAKEHSSADPERSAELILRALPPVRLIDDVCLARDCGVSPPEGEGAACVNYKKHMERFEGDEKKALEAWRAGDIQQRLNSTWPCAEVVEEAKRQFKEKIDRAWGVFEPGGLMEDLTYIQDHLGRVPPRIQEKWKSEFIIIFGREKTFSQFDEREASWLRRKLAGYVATAPKAARPQPGKPHRAKR